MPDYSVLHLAHRAIRGAVRPGDFCVDATMGRGKDTALLCELVGPAGEVLALDIQPEALASTHAHLESLGLRDRARLVQGSHSNLLAHAAPGRARCVVFNFGWLPAGDHNIFTTAATSLPAVDQALELLMPGGILSLCIYYGRENGYEERDALLSHLAALDPARYTVLLHSFHNRGGDSPLFALITKDDQ